jgi:hypothetical protein
MPILPSSTRGPLALARVGHAILATVVLCAQPAHAYQVTQQMNQPEARDASGRITVEASIIHVVACNGAGENGGQFYVYQYVNRPGFLAIKPPEWTRHIGGRQYASFQEAAGVACAAASPPPPPVQRPASICPFLPGNPLQMTRYLHMNSEGGAINYYFSPQHNIYCGYGAVHSAEFTGRYLRQEGNGFVGYVMSNGQLARSTYYNRDRTDTHAGVVWDSGHFVGAENPRRTGSWRSRWM